METMTAKEANKFMRAFLAKEAAGDFAEDPYDTALTLFDFIVMQTRMRGRRWTLFMTLLRLYAGCLTEVSRDSAVRRQSRGVDRSPGVARIAA
jgi:hypothetical protein